MAPSDAIEKNCNIGAQLVHSAYNGSKKILENLLPVGLLVHADRERRDNSKRSQLFFDPAHSFSCRGENADFWSLTH